ncbi:Uncharacterised protein [Mycobacteroides abscessus subsp. abscessus]|nr:Uncharacterised protein [Mycobacteroides abscessus subsp. abscessus]
MRSLRSILPARCATDDTAITRSVSLGSSRLVSANAPRWFVPIWLSKPSTVLAGGTIMMPALFTKMSALSTVPAKACTDARSATST